MMTMKEKSKLIVLRKLTRMGMMFIILFICAVPAWATVALDTAFSTDGIVLHDSAAGGTDNDVANAVTFDSSGRMIVAGCSQNDHPTTPTNDMVLWRYKKDGTLDATFDTDGIVKHNGAAGGGESQDCATAVAIDNFGKIVVAGWSMNAGGNFDMVLWRFNDDGSLDTTFNNPNGFIVHGNAAGGNSDDQASAVAIDKINRIVVVGWSKNADATSNYDMVVWRYNTAGALDTANFNGSGFVVHGKAAGTNKHDLATGVAIDGIGRIVVAGSMLMPAAMPTWSCGDSATAER
jgi:uncharacterized delta-60 repeat protein